jgi:3'-phosphoadenosine 5'-phosphosulfate sulfotransferase (PAPS reductase)/FAD synthetase
MPATYHLPHLRTLEAEAVHVMREVAAEFERPVLLFSGGKDSIRQGRVVDQTGPRASRNGLQTVTLLDAISKHGFDSAFGGARRGEERARAKERVLSFRDEFGQWEPQRQRPEVWSRRRCGAYTMDASARGSTRGSFRSPTGPSSTCGST